MGASLLALANEIYMLLKDANILPLQFSYYESIAKLMLDIGNKTAAANIPELFEEISNVHFYNTSSSSSNNFYTKPSWLELWWSMDIFWNYDIIIIYCIIIFLFFFFTGIYLFNKNVAKRLNITWDQAQFERFSYILSNGYR